MTRCAYIKHRKSTNHTPMSFLEQLIYSTITLSGQICSIHRHTTVLPLDALSGYDIPPQIHINSLPCRAIKQYIDIPKTLEKAYNREEKRYVMYINSTKNGVLYDINITDIVHFEGIYYDIIKLEMPSGSGINGLQNTYYKLEICSINRY